MDGPGSSERWEGLTAREGIGQSARDKWRGGKEGMDPNRAPAGAESGAAVVLPSQCQEQGASVMSRARAASSTLLPLCLQHPPCAPKVKAQPPPAAGSSFLPFLFRHSSVHCIQSRQPRSQTRFRFATVLCTAQYLTLL